MSAAVGSLVWDGITSATLPARVRVVLQEYQVIQDAYHNKMLMAERQSFVLTGFQYGRGVVGGERGREREREREKKTGDRERS